MHKVCFHRFLAGAVGSRALGEHLRLAAGLPASMRMRARARTRTHTHKYVHAHAHAQTSTRAVATRFINTVSWQSNVKK